MSFAPNVLPFNIRRTQLISPVHGTVSSLIGATAVLLSSQPGARAADAATAAPVREAATPLIASIQGPPPVASSRLTDVALLDPTAPVPAGTVSRYTITPERRALLNTIRFAEGTWARGEDLGYRIMFGGGLMPSLERHPDRVNYSGGYASAAAGAYQFMPFTWARASQALQLTGFGPQVQDQAALFLIERRGALALADQGQFSPHLAARLAPEWASFPTMAGSSYYGQPVQRYAVLRSFYERNLAELRAAMAPAQPVAVTPSCEPVESLRCKLESLDRVGPRSLAQGR